MDITCPSCGTPFSVPDGAIGPKGRKLKCSQCAHVWRQMPDQPEAPAYSAAPSSARQAQAPRQFRAVEDDDFTPPSRRDTASAFGAGAVPMEMDPTPARAGGRSSRPEPRSDDPFEAVMRGLEDNDDFSGNDRTEDDPFADLGLDDGFGNDRRPAARDTRDRGFDEDGFGDDDFSAFRADDDMGLRETDDGFLSADSDDLPDMFQRTPQPGKRRLLVPLLAVVIALLVIGGGLAGAAWYWREKIVLRFPELESLYSMAGLSVDVPGLGLTFRETTNERLAQGGVDTLIVRGFIENISDTPRRVPFLHLMLYDGTGAIVQEMAAQPPLPELLPGETTGFRVQLPNPSAAARRFDLFWAAPPAKTDGGEAATGKDMAEPGGTMAPTDPAKTDKKPAPQTH